MKKINDYIAEKANFIVKKHVSNTTNEITLNDLHDGDYYAVDYPGDDGKTLLTMLGVFKSIGGQNEYVETYMQVRDIYGVDEKTTDIESGSDYFCEETDIYRTLTNEEKQLIEEILSKYNFFKNKDVQKTVLRLEGKTKKIVTK